MIVTRLCALALAIVVTFQTAQATVFVYNFTGTNVSSLVPGTGRTFSGSFSFDDSVLPFFTDSFGGGTYSEYQAALTISFQSGTASTVATGFDMDALAVVDNDVDIGPGPQDDFDLSIGGLGGTVTGGFYNLTVQLNDTTGGVFNSTALPTSLSSSDFDQMKFFAIFQDNTDYEGTITSLTLVSAAVPEPATWATLLVGLVLIGGAMRRHRAVTAFR